MSACLSERTPEFVATVIYVLLFAASAATAQSVVTGSEFIRIHDDAGNLSWVVKSEATTVTEVLADFTGEPQPAAPQLPGPPNTREVAGHGVFVGVVRSEDGTGSQP